MDITSAILDVKPVVLSLKHAGYNGSKTVTKMKKNMSILLIIA